MFVNENMRYKTVNGAMMEYDWRKEAEEDIMRMTKFDRDRKSIYAEIKPSILGDGYIDVVFFGPEETCEIFGARHSIQNNHNAYDDGHGGMCHWCGTIKTEEYDAMKSEFIKLAYDPDLEQKSPTFFDRIKSLALICKANYDIKHNGASKEVEDFKQIIEGAVLVHYGDKLPQVPLHFPATERSELCGAIQIMAPENGEQSMQTIGSWDYEAFVNGDTDAFYIEPENIAIVEKLYEEYALNQEDIETEFEQAQ